MPPTVTARISPTRSAAGKRATCGAGIGRRAGACPRTDAGPKLRGNDPVTSRSPRPMDLRHLVRRIADALGPDATPERVERIALALLAPDEDAPAAAPPFGSHAVLVATGPASDGLLAALDAAVREAGARVGDVTQRVEAGRASVRMDLDLGPARLPLADLRARLDAAGRAAGAAVVVQPADLHAALL